MWKQEKDKVLSLGYAVNPSTKGAVSVERKKPKIKIC